MKISIFSLVISIAVAILSLFQFERYQNLESATESHIEVLSNNLNPRIQSLQQDVHKLTNQELPLSTQPPAAISLITEVEYLSNMAEVNLKTTGDVDTAIRLLTLAETKLLNMNDVNLSALRQALAEDRTALQAIKQANTMELWAQITRMMSDVPDLPLCGIRKKADHVSPEKTITPETQRPDENQHWQASLAKSWQQIKDLIKIRHHAKPIEPILSDNQAQLAKQNLLLLLEQLRLSVLQKNQILYTNLITEMKAWLATYFEVMDPNVIAMQHTLMDLEQETLKPVLPNLKSLIQLSSLRN